MFNDEKLEEVCQKFSLDLPKETWKKLKVYAMENDKKMKDVVIELLENL